MTYSAQSAKASKVRNAINVYVSATIFGGFSGRLLGGVLSDISSWRLPFLLTSGLLLLSCALLATLPSENKSAANKIELGAARRILSQPFYRDAYLCVFLVFFVFASMLNYLPFRLKSIDPEISESMLSLLYLGYLSGSLIAFNGSRIADWFDGELRGVFAGLLLLGCGIGATLIPNLLSTYLVAFAMCAAFFLAHSLLAAYLNHHTQLVARGSQWLVPVVLLFGWCARWLAAGIHLPRRRLGRLRNRATHGAKPGDLVVMAHAARCRVNCHENRMTAEGGDSDHTTHCNRPAVSALRCEPGTILMANSPRLLKSWMAS